MPTYSTCHKCGKRYRTDVSWSPHLCRPQPQSLDRPEVLDAIVAALTSTITTLTHDVIAPLEPHAPGYYRRIALSHAIQARALLRAAHANLRTREQRSYYPVHADRFPTSCDDCNTTIPVGTTYYEHTFDPIQSRRTIESLCPPCHLNRLRNDPSLSSPMPID